MTLGHHSEVHVLPTPSASASSLVGDCPLPLGQVFRCPWTPLCWDICLGGWGMLWGHCGAGGWMGFPLP